MENEKINFFFGNKMAYSKDAKFSVNFERPKIVKVAESVIKINPPVKSEVGVKFITPKERHILDSATVDIENKMSEFVLDFTQMYFMSWEDMVKLSVCEIFSEKTFGEGSLGDLRMGVLEKNVVCKTCHKTNLICPGHCGRIKFNHTFPHPLLIKFIINLLQCVCNCCGCLILDEKTILKNVGGIRDPHARVKKLALLSAKIKCSKKHPNSKQPCTINPTYKKSESKDVYKIFYHYENKNNIFERTIDEIENIFKSVPDKDCRLIGFENGIRPDNLLLKGLPVMPIQARPYTFQDGEKKQSYLTGALADIIKLNNSLLNYENNNDDGAGRDKNLTELYKMIYHYIDNTDGTYFKSPDEIILTIKQKLVGKDGYIREFVSGKRNNFTLRSVAGPARVEFGYVEIPEATRGILSVPETVTPYNHKNILKKYNEGKITGLIYFSEENNGKQGSHFVIRDSTRGNYEPHLRDVVERHLEEGDYVITNRQPTLHHFGISGHKIKYTKDLTIKSHSSTTTPYNLDFDGDEKNVLIPQTETAIAECKNSFNITSYVMNDQNNRNMIGLVFNCPKSAWLMTNPNLQIDEKSWNEALIAGDIFQDRIHSLDSRLKKWNIKKYTGRALFSLLLPENFYYDNGSIKIRDGILLSGRITKDHIGPQSNSIIQYLNKMHSKKELIAFFTQGQFLLDWFISWYGFSVGYSSCIIDDPQKIKNVVKEEMSKALIQIEALGNPENLKNSEEREKYEFQIIGILNNVSTIGKSISIEALSEDNAFNVMAISKSKGTVVNIAQIVGLVGQQLVRNKRPAKTLNGGKRSLVHYEINDPSLEASGFISENFLEGMSPGGTFFHAAASREGLVDTAAGTAEVGAMHRRINKVLEDSFINYKGCVVDKNTIFQYIFGDGFDTKHIISTSSASTGSVVNFIDYSHVVGRLNLKYGVDYIR